MATSALLCGTAGSVCCDLCECTAVVCRHPLYSVVRQVASVVICVSAQLLYVDIRSTLWYGRYRALSLSVHCTHTWKGRQLRNTFLCMLSNVIILMFYYLSQEKHNVVKVKHSV